MKAAQHESILGDSSKVALFDFDGTLADTTKAHELARKAAIKELVAEDVRMRLTEDLQAEAHRHGSHPHEIIGWLLKAVNAHDDDLLDAIVARKKELYVQEAREGLPQIAGAVAFMGYALDYYRDTAIVTTAASREVVPFIHRHGVALDESKIISGDVTNGNRTLYKPHPFLYSRAIELLAITPDNAFAIEDSPRGIQSALSAGIAHVVSIETTHPGDDLREAGATESYKNYNDLQSQL